MSLLDDTEVRALHEALDDEHKAWATYDQVIHDFGPERPFINIREAEAETHRGAPRALPALRPAAAGESRGWVGFRVFASTREACEAGIEAEVANAAIYERLMRSHDAGGASCAVFRQPAASVARASLAGLSSVLDPRLRERARVGARSRSRKRRWMMGSRGEKGGGDFERFVAAVEGIRRAT